MRQSPRLMYSIFGLSVSCVPVIYCYDVLFKNKFEENIVEKIFATVLFIPAVLWTTTIVVTVPIGFILGVIHENVT